MAARSAFRSSRNSWTNGSSASSSAASAWWPGKRPVTSRGSIASRDLRAEQPEGLRQDAVSYCLQALQLFGDAGQLQAQTNDLVIFPVHRRGLGAWLPMLWVAETQDELLAGFASVAGQSLDALGGHGQVEATFFAGQLDQADTVAKAGHQREGFVVPVFGDVAELG